LHRKNSNIPAEETDGASTVEENAKKERQTGEMILRPEHPRSDFMRDTYSGMREVKVCQRQACLDNMTLSRLLILDQGY